MTKIPMVQTKTGQPKSSELLSYSDCRPLPASYMSEYSVLGLIVDDLEKAMEVASDNGLYITREVFGAEVDINDLAGVSSIVELFFRVGINCSIGDVIDSVYQG